MAKKQGKAGEPKSDVLREIPLACADEAVAVEFMEKQRWGDKPYCPRCGSENVYQMKDAETNERNRRFLWRCRGCKRQYTVRIGTVFEESRIPLRHWCYAFWAACASKKGVSAMQIQRQCQVSYKTALFMMHRIRYAMAEPGPSPKLDGVVEADETYIGGKPRRGSKPGRRGRGTRKTPVMAIIQRDGEARAQVIPDVTGKTLKGAIREHVHESARINTDEFLSYRSLRYTWPGGHDTVRHSLGEYTRGSAHTNTAESFFALLKRGIYGTFHAVSKKHLHRYVSEFQFRWNTRKLDDGARLVAAIRGAEGKRLMYREPIQKAS